jgi:hypothetical protein
MPEDNSAADEIDRSSPVTFTTAAAQQRPSALIESQHVAHTLSQNKTVYAQDAAYETVHSHTVHISCACKHKRRVFATAQRCRARGVPNTLLVQANMVQMRRA